MTTYIISNVPNLGPHESQWTSLAAAEEYMAARGYVYQASAPCDHPTEEARYYAHPSHAEECGVDMDAADLLDTVYGYGYEPVITPTVMD